MKLRRKVMPKELFFGGVAIGDVIFLVVIIPLFSFINYTIFYVSGMIFSLILHFFVVRFKLDKKETVPLAGYLSVFLLFIFCLDRILKINLFSTELFSL
ncbi:hypothetical protein PG911_10490 [Tenacibaculum ovolyticum]|uniref:hypothetical protein n=1 Tax=Tenacibaculum ovolyticum TaxID=104270 RepID=UPI0022F3E002|nr:hypothetical protein [Tenacibaculum ovolyticum]WBX75085.1 hypothetical protein PG911_10490 [Tenacibaculum ovolyticum]